jgi:hypothetical protein
VDLATNAVIDFTISIPTTAQPLDRKPNLTVVRLLEYYLTARNKDNIKIGCFNVVFTWLIH